MQININRWPYSQYCMECVHGEPIQSETFDHNDYYCKIGKVDKADDFCLCPMSRAGRMEREKFDAVNKLISMEARAVHETAIFNAAEWNGQFIIMEIVDGGFTPKHLGMVRIDRSDWSYLITYKP